MLYLWLKALHVIFVIAWFAGLFYLPRLFVYHADARDTISDERFKVMERRLYKLMTLAATVAVLLAAALLVLMPTWLHHTWLLAKIVLVALLLAYHVGCGRLVAAFREGRNRHAGTWYRWFNEIPTLLLFAIVVLAIVKPG
jgi:protoporphyrinogen IX oxidase